MTELTTAAVADALIRLGHRAECGPAGLHAVVPGHPISGPAAPITHLGSVDVLLETIGDAEPGSIMVVDNGGRADESCVGDLMVLEAKSAGLAGIVIWGYHRDTAQLVEIGLPVFSLGAFPRGPIRVPPAGAPMGSAVVGGVPIRPGDRVVADDDGIVFVPSAVWETVRETAATIMSIESAQSDRMRGGTSLREQIGFDRYLDLRAATPTYSLRDHLAAEGGAIET